jgi:hypothetical protein
MGVAYQEYKDALAEYQIFRKGLSEVGSCIIATTGPAANPCLKYIHQWAFKIRDRATEDKELKLQDTLKSFRKFRSEYSMEGRKPANIAFANFQGE